jgi:hypothetical protein
MSPCHSLVTQFRFARAQFMACLEKISGNDDQKHLNSMDCLSWIVGHPAIQEHRYRVKAAQGKNSS